MKQLIKRYIRKQIEYLFEQETVNPAEAIKSRETEVAATEEELETIKKQQKDTLLQQQNRQKVTGTQVGTLGDEKSKNIKTTDVKRDVEIYKSELDKLKNKQTAEEQGLELKKSQLDAEKAAATGGATAVSSPSAPVAP